MIPIYRAKKINSDEWVEGYLTYNRHYPNKTPKWILPTTIKSTIAIEIDQKTLSIHFPTMLEKMVKRYLLVLI